MINVKPVIATWAGFCPICNAATRFSATNTWYRDFLICENCRSIPRERAVITVIDNIKPEWRKLRIHECSPGDVASSRLLKTECPGYVPTHYFKDVALGSTHNGVRCEDIEHQTFPDNEFDIVLTQDVYEHIFDPALATKEIHRTLKPGGVSILTTGVWKDKLKTETWASKQADGKIIHHVTPPEYHGNPISTEGSLVTFKFGYDFVDLLATWAPFGVELRRFNDRHHGIVGEFTDVMICRKQF